MLPPLLPGVDPPLLLPLFVLPLLLVMLISGVEPPEMGSHEPG